MDCSNWPYQDPQTGRYGRTQAIVLGLGSLFNHSTNKLNVVWQRDVESQSITYRALRDIGKGEELCISYGRLWFEDADEHADEVSKNIHWQEDELDMLNRIEPGIL